MKVYWLRVHNRADRTIAAIVGTDAAGVIHRDEAVYAKYPGRDFHIERGILFSGDYVDLPGAPTSATPQQWAEFALTPAAT